MSRFLKLTVITIACMIVIAIAVLKMISDAQYKDWVISTVESATGRNFSIETLELDFNSDLAVRATGITLANAEWSNSPEMFAVDRVDVSLNLFSLFKRVAEITLQMENPDIRFETSSDGRRNWVMNSDSVDNEQPETTGGITGLPVIPLIRELRIDDATIRLLIGNNKPQPIIQIHELLVKTPDTQSTIEVTGLIGQGPLHLEGNLGNLKSAIADSSEEINLSGLFEQNTLAISGVWGPLVPSANMELKLDVSVESASKLVALAGLTFEDIGKLKGKAVLTASDGLFALKQLLADLDGDVAEAEIEGSISDLSGLSGLNLAAVATTSALNDLLTRLNIDVPVELPANVHVGAQVRGSFTSLEISELKAEIGDEGLEITVTDSADTQPESGGIRSDFVIKADSLSSLSKYTTIDLPDLGAIIASGKIRSENGTVSLNSVDAKLASDNINLNVTGGVADVQKVKGIDLMLDASIKSLTQQNLSELEDLLTQSKIKADVTMLPKSMKIAAHIHGDLENLAANDIQAAVADEGLSFNLTGIVANVFGPTGVDADFDLKSETLSTFSKYINYELPNTGELDLSGHIESKGALLSLDSLDATLIQDGVDMQLTASVDNLLTIDGINANMAAEVVSLDKLSGFSKAALPGTDPITLQAQLKSNAGSKLTALTINATSAGVTAAIAGSISNLKTLDNVQAAFDLKSDSLKDFEKFARTELPDKGPLTLSGKVQFGQSEYSLNDFKFTLDDQAAYGQISLIIAEPDAGLSTLKGDLNIPYLDLTAVVFGDPSDEPPVEPTPDQTDVVNPSQGGNRQQSGTMESQADEPASEQSDENYERLFSPEPFLLDQFRQFDVDISVAADRLVLGKTDMRNIVIPVLLKQGRLTIDPIEAFAGEGNINGKIVFDAGTDNPSFSLDLSLDDIPMPLLGGELDFNADLDGHGNSMANIMGGLNGQLVLLAKDGVIARSVISSVGTGLFSFSENKSEQTLECGILRVDIKDGLADFDKKLAVQFDDVTWSGGGEIDFKTEKLGAGIVPKPRTGVGISAGMLANLVYVGGTLKNPKPSLNPSDVAIKYGKYLAFLSTGGLSLLAEAMINKSQANSDVCVKISDGTVFDESGEIDPNKSAQEISTPEPKPKPEQQQQEEDNKP